MLIGTFVIRCKTAGKKTDYFKAKLARPLAFLVIADHSDGWDFSSIENTGGQVFSVLHNGNLSNGLMFAKTPIKGEAGNELDTEGLEILLPIFN